jgi:ATP-binding cassette subfamily B (MDR/TAP) protein 1
VVLGVRSEFVSHAIYEQTRFCGISRLTSFLFCFVAVVLRDSPLLVVQILPFMAFGAAAEMQMYLGEDESGGDSEEQSSGRIVIESLTNIRTVASLSLEEARKSKFKAALLHEDPHPFRTNLIKGSTNGLGQFCQMWGIALMYWWGGWLQFTYPDTYDADSFLISMFSLLFSLSGTGAATQGITDKGKAQAAADRIFALMERKSEIDPLDTSGKKDL